RFRKAELVKLCTARVPVPEEASMRMALFVRVWPAPKFKAAALGAWALPGKKRMWPAWAAATTVTLTATALAVAGAPHGPVAPATVRTRAAPGGSAGPPVGPLGFRVSSRRQGGRV